MSVLDDLGQFMQANGFGILGQTIFLGSFPQDAPGAGVQDAILALFEVPGFPPHLVHDLVGPSVEQPVIQMRWRGEPFGYAAARQKAGQAFRLLGGIVNQTINGVFYQQIQCRQNPYGFPADEWNRPSVAFEIHCERDGQAP